MSHPTPVLPSWWRQAANVILGLLLVAWIFHSLRQYLYSFPITIESIWQIFLAEVNRQKNIRRVRTLGRRLSLDDEKGFGRTPPAVRCLASVVGYREEPTVFRKCLRSYYGSPGLTTMVVGIDGDQAEDMEMVEIAEEVVAYVFPGTLVKIHVKEPYGPLAVRFAQNYVEWRLESDRNVKPKPYLSKDDPEAIPPILLRESRQYALRKVYDLAVSTLQAHQVLRLDKSPSSLRGICIYQPHLCKKDIMFTNMIYCLALGQTNDIEYLWTSDSDTWVYPDTLSQTIGCMSADALIGGSCSALSIHNENESVIAALGSAAYWSELAITRGQTGACDAVDCQPGPCAAFRLAALEPILVDWYTQTSLGVKTVVNEDRHLTTCLLLGGWKVTFNTSALASTDTPTTLLRWLLQQLRWARATHIETFQYPAVYAIHGPIILVTAMRRFYGPLLIGIFTIRYVLTGHTVRAYALSDLALRILLCTIYNLITNKKEINGIFYLIFSQIFYQLPLPGIILWSTLTVLEGGWGTRMRSQSENAKGRRAGWENLWSTTAVVIWMGFVGAALARIVTEKLGVRWVLEAMVGTAATTAMVLFYALLG